MKICIYTRVSTFDQTVQNQVIELRQFAVARNWEIVSEFEDIGFSGSTEKRPGLDQLMRGAFNRKFEGVLVSRFDRFARSTKHLITALETFRNLNIHFISLSEQFDTSTPVGFAMFTIFGAMGQLEKDIIKERVKSGMKRARLEGRQIGRPVSVIDIQKVRDLRTKGLSIREISKELGVPRSTIAKRLAQ